MRIEATAPEIGRLLQLAELDAQAESLSPEAYRGRRETARKRVPRALLDRYQTLLEGGRSPVLAPIERGACSGCHIRLPTMLEYKAKRWPAIHTCPHCHCMLYAPGFLQETASSPVSERKPAARRGTRSAHTKELA